MASSMVLLITLFFVFCLEAGERGHASAILGLWWICWCHIGEVELVHGEGYGVLIWFLVRNSDGLC